MVTRVQCQVFLLMCLVGLSLRIDFIRSWLKLQQHLEEGQKNT